MLTSQQHNALKILKEKIQNKTPITVLQGAAGSGKSFTLSYLIEELNYQSSEVHFCAFTGVAAKLLIDKGLQASTIHKLIYEPIVHRGICIGFRKKTRDLLSHIKLIVVDEYSMVGQELLDDLSSYEIQILLVGDPYQLPPISTPNKFYGYYDVILTQIHRQALESPILWAATQIRNGELLKEGTYGDILFVGRKHQLKEEWLRKDVQFLCGTNTTRKKLNLDISGSVELEKGEKVMFLKNDWSNFIINGSLGKVLDIRKNFDKYKLKVRVDDDLFENYAVYFEPESVPKRFPKQMKNIVTKGYAITTHKSQGSTIFDSMVIIDESFCFKGDESKWLYTAVSRSAGVKPVALLR